jgi:copper homeostasis protein CutC
VTESNAVSIVQATGVPEIHGSLRRRQESPMEFRNLSCLLSADGQDFVKMVTDEAKVVQCVKNVSQLQWQK